MNILLVRIDDRFIHGQVVTRWVKEYPAERLIVVSDAVEADELRKSLLISVAPSNMTANVVSVEKIIKAWASPRYENVTAFLLFENPGDILRMVQGGVKIDSINVGGMRFDNDREQVTKSVSVSEKDIAAFRALQQLGIKQELRQLPSDTPVDFMTKLK